MPPSPTRKPQHHVALGKRRRHSRLERSQPEHRLDGRFAVQPPIAQLAGGRRTERTGDLRRLLFIWSPQSIGVATQPAEPGRVVQSLLIDLSEYVGDVLGGADFIHGAPHERWTASSNQGKTLSIAKRTDRGYITHYEILV